MPSPFPGMDPYLEVQPYWSDFHTAMILMLKAELQKLVPAHYSVWGDIHVWLHEPDAKTRIKIRPDAFVTEKSDRPRGGVAKSALVAPATTVLPAVRKTGGRYIKIKEAQTERVVTVVELLSPTNKRRGEERDEYLAKREQYFAQRINLVELDFLRKGMRMPLGRPSPPEAPYYAAVSRGEDYPRVGVWPLSLREPLPELPIPLDPEDDMIWLPLQKCFVAAYDIGPYAKEINYRKSARPPLEPGDAAWFERRLAKSS